MPKLISHTVWWIGLSNTRTVGVAPRTQKRTLQQILAIVSSQWQALPEILVYLVTAVLGITRAHLQNLTVSEQKHLSEDFACEAQSHWPGGGFAIAAAVAAVAGVGVAVGAVVAVAAAAAAEYAAAAVGPAAGPAVEPQRPLACQRRLVSVIELLSALVWLVARDSFLLG